MRINQVEQVFAIAKAGSFSQAAHDLYISQPNLSASIRDLEKELGNKLFKRNGKGVELTPFGSEFIAYSEPVLQYYGNLRDFCTNVNASSMKRLRIASTYFRFASLLFGRFCAACEDSSYELSYLEGTNEEVLDWVRNQEADLGLIAQPPHQKKMRQASYERNDVIYTPILRQKLCVILRSDHPLCRLGDTVSCRQLKNYPLVLYRDSNYGRTELVEHVHGITSTRKIIVNDRAVLHEILAQTDAFTIGAHSRSAFKDNPYYSGTSTLQISDWHDELELGYLISKSRPLSEAASEYLQSIRTALGVD